MHGDVEITVLVDNATSAAGLCAEHGLALLLTIGGKQVLFDSGAGEALLPNARALGVDLSRIDAVVLSHGHYDHTGGLPDVIEASPQVRVFLHPEALGSKYAWKQDGPKRYIGAPPRLRNLLQLQPARVVHTSAGVEVAPGLFVTGHIPRATDFEEGTSHFYLGEACAEPDRLIDDQALYFHARGSVVAVLGCAHAGVVNTLRHITRLADTPLHAVVGGMHLSAAPDTRIAQTVGALGGMSPELIAPLHCTGEAACTTLRRAFPHAYRSLAAGQSVVFPR